MDIKREKVIITIWIVLLIVICLWSLFTEIDLSMSYYYDMPFLKGHDIINLLLDIIRYFSCLSIFLCVGLLLEFVFFKHSWKSLLVTSIILIFVLLLFIMWFYSKSIEYYSYCSGFNDESFLYRKAYDVFFRNGIIIYGVISVIGILGSLWLGNTISHGVKTRLEHY